MSTELVLCYNRGCGQRFDPNDNQEESCSHHPGVPVFHDAYKGWSCCKKKCTDFTEFLNIPGCSRAYHNSVKPAEPEKPVVDKSTANDIIEYKAPEPIKPSSLQRPPFESPLIKLKSTVSATLQQELEKLKLTENTSDKFTPFLTDDTIKPGTLCKNGGCNVTFVNEASHDSTCNYHPGVPIFHEGLKYWTCCTRRTTDFQAFLNQEGCAQGSHNWKNDQAEKSKVVKCRHDWMQTGTHVIVNVYCKKYDPGNQDLTYIEVNPIRLKIRIYFPESGTSYDSDLELRGMIDTINSSVTFTPSKVEIKLKKAEPMSWNRLDVPRAVVVAAPEPSVKEENVPRVDAVDLSDI